MLRLLTAEGFNRILATRPRGSPFTVCGEDNYPYLLLSTEARAKSVVVMSERVGSG